MPSIPRPQGLSNLTFQLVNLLTNSYTYLYTTRMHEHILSYLQNASKNGALAHGHALIGPTSSGKMELLEDFLKGFFNAQSLGHPDIRIIEPQEDVITIGVIREARSWLSMTPLASDKKALVIKHAEAMNAEAQNAFLKILEEPTPSTFIFLLASHSKRILATVYSRVVALHFAPNAPEALGASPSHLIHSLVALPGAPERMRAWLAEGIAKEDMRPWLAEALPTLRRHLKSRRSPAIALAIRSLIEALARPKGQNWQLAAERLIISL